ncbi:aldose 1-epimerase family protein [Novipirellula artificiosorum]|uniref:DUF4432 domain-containing protein n=1 Tax=Novipirellula artificiosorum TaxID=2528016 RepID=A0A5C6E5K9_9BACT|nr:aldose 1-epimerase family protein [Novipirellula artificiosorum]TWU42891.1 hypothetical protein Poly41_11920 [Novipirellula artificiosorum]
MTETASHRIWHDRESQIVWDDASPLSMAVETRQGNIQTRHGRFVGGVSHGVEVVEIDSGAVRVTVLPTRGMSIWKIESEGIRYGWDSPISGPVHPALVPTFDPSGLGWLEGFDELVVRCGLESNGAPQHDEQGQLVYPLHGRIGNLAADSLAIEYDEASGRLDLVGEVIESRLFFKRLRLKSRIRVQAGSHRVYLMDDVTNELSTEATMQLLYHINIGSPILEEGAVLEAPIEELAPKDALSAAEMDHWNQFEKPENGYRERVYFATLCHDDSNETTTMVRSQDKSRGMAVTYNTSKLPRFILWKNTAAKSDGYVVGMEPATNYPNARSFETEQDRMVTLQPGETVSFRLSLLPLINQQAVEKTSQRIKELSTHHDPVIHAQPKKGWSVDS